MRKTLRGAAFLSVILPLCACSNSQAVSHQTFRTVDTTGITAYKTPTDKFGNYITDEEEPQETLPFETTSSETTTAVSSFTTTQNSLDIQATSKAGDVTTTTEAPIVTTTTTEAVTTVTPAALSESGGYEVIGDNGILVARLADGHYWGLMPCWGTYGLCESWAESADKFAAELPNVKAYQMTIPTSSEFYVPKSYSSGFTGSQRAKAEHIAENLKIVENVDIYTILSGHLDEKLYSRTDHHWFPLGAYYAASVFAEKAGVPFADLSEYTLVTKGGYVGSMYGYSNDIHLKNDPEDFDLYLSPNRDKLTTYYYNSAFENGYESNLFTSPDGGAYYCSFLGSDDRIAEIKTDCDNNRTLVIFKESYGNALVPFLTSSFETIYVCDIRYFDLNAVDFCKKVGATDLLFAVCTYTPAGNNGTYLSQIISQ